MIITKKFIPRRTILRGIGATLALPLLDGMVPALTALEKTAARAVKRFGVVYLPNGIVMQNFTPTAEGRAYEFSPSLKPLESFRDRLTVVTGLEHKNGGGHSGGGTRFLTHAKPKSGSEVGADISLDQVVAKEFGKETQLASLELAMEVGETGNCEPGNSCLYTNTISWRSPTTPLQTENNPRLVFERLFGDSGSTDPAVRLGQIRTDASLLDSVSGKVSRLQRELGSRDRGRLSDYLEAVRDVERRIQKAEEQSGRELPVVEQPVGIPATFEEHVRLLFDLQVLAYQTDLTRVFTFMFGRELSGRGYPEIGVPEAHHPLSHHGGAPEKLAGLTKINTFHISHFGYFLEKLKSLREGDSSVLDNSMLIYGAGMSDGNSHSNVNLPVLVAGGCAGELKGGHFVFPKSPLANLHVSLLEKLGLGQERFGNSTGRLAV